jgi:hypothetical protein
MAMIKKAFKKCLGHYVNVYTYCYNYDACIHMIKIH